MNTANEGLTGPKNTNFRLYLQDVLANRCKKNPHYSLRAFAASISIDHSYLSQLLRGKRNFTSKMKLRIGKELGLGPDEIKTFLSQSDRGSASLNQLAADQFAQISDWYYDAICELIHVKDFQGDNKWIAAQLDITPSEVNLAVERLQRLGLLEITEDGRWLEKQGNCETVINEFTDVARKKHQKQVLQKAIDSVDNVPFQDRVNSSMCFAISEENFEKVKELIKKFDQELTDIVVDSSNAEKVYEFTLGLFPLSNPANSSKSILEDFNPAPTEIL